MIVPKMIDYKWKPLLGLNAELKAISWKIMLLVWKIMLYSHEKVVIKQFNANYWFYAPIYAK